jgi:hypothetical protein
VATRPLRVAELAEVLAVDFNDAEEIPRLNTDWRWEDQEEALLIACSSLIAIVQAGDSRVVQFSHFSVKEFLTSPRLATETRDVSNHHIDLEPAHTILAQACLGVLLQIRIDVEGHTPDDHPLARYAAEHWTTHAQFGAVSSRLHKGMKYLFDRNKPHFKVWLTLWDINTRPKSGATFYEFASLGKSGAGPLYYAALCGFRDLVEHLITKYPREDVNATGGYYRRPLVAALAGEHFQTADLLHQHGANQRVQSGWYRVYPLHAAARHGSLEVIRRLIEYDPANINANDGDGWTPLHWAIARDGALEVVRLLLEHGAYVNSQTNDDETALQLAAYKGYVEVVKLLRERGAK